jgi:hypothetical protein
MALTTAKSCDTAQLDVVSAYLNSNPDETVYCEFPEGFESADGAFLLLFLALYELRCSEKLWQDNLTRKMLALGIGQVPDEPCLFTTSQSAEIVDTVNPNLSTAIRRNVASTGADEHIVQVIIFFYVDDIIMICSPNEASHKRMAQIKASLCETYEMRDMGEISWFLKIRVLQDCKQKKLWLIQDTYMDNLASKFNLTYGAPALIPVYVAVRSFIPNEGESTPEKTLLYQ